MFTSKKFFLIGGALLLVGFLLSGVVYTMNLSESHDQSNPYLVNGQTNESFDSSATTASADSAICGNGIVEAGEECDPLDPGTGLECNFDCIKPPYDDPLECLDDRYNQNCVDANSNPGANYYDCVDAQYEYCQSLTY